AAGVVEQVGIGVVVAGHGRRLGDQDGPAAAVVLEEPLPFVAAALHVVVDVQHDLAVGVGADDVLVAIGECLGRFCRPTVEAGAVGAAGVGVGVDAQAVAAHRAGGAGHGVLGDALGGVVLEVVVGVGRGIAVRDALDVRALGGDQAGVTV